MVDNILPRLEDALTMDYYRCNPYQDKVLLRLRFPSQMHRPKHDNSKARIGSCTQMICFRSRPQ